MSESQQHIDLVQVALKHIKSIVPDNMEEIIQCDSSDTRRPSKVSGNFIPDLYFWNKDILIIGEAKTVDDFNRKHSREQFMAYLSECHSFYGQSFLVVSIPWQLWATAKNYFIKQKREMQCSTTIIIINQLERICEI